MEVNDYLKKITLLLEKVLDGKTFITENHTEILLKFLEDRTENSIGKQILDAPCFSDYIFRAFENVNNANNSVKVLLIKIITILFKNELQFSKMQIMKGLQTSCKLCILDILNETEPPNLHLACIKLAIVEITHCSGLTVIIENKVWKKILLPDTHHKPRKISDAVYEFITKLVWRLNEHNKETVLLEVLSDIVEPILKSEYFHVPVIDAETDIALTDKIFTHISALLAVISEADKYAPVNKVMSILKEYFVIDHRLYDMFNLSKNPVLLKLLTYFLLRYSYQVHRPLLYTDKADEFCNKMAVFHRNYVVNAVNRREAYAVIDFVIQSNIIWSHFEKSHKTDLNFPLTFKRNGQDVEFSLQIVVNLVMPMIKYSAMHRMSNKLGMTDVIERFIAKLGSVITDYIYTSCFLFGTMLEEAGPTFRKKVTTYALKELLRLKNHINESQAGILFQSVYYLLDTFIVCDESGALVVNENPMDSDDLRLLTHLLNAITMLLKEHNIPWYDNLEIVSVQSDLLNLLKQSFLTTKQLVQVIDLINIGVNKFLSPNMSLLVDDKCPDNTLHDIGEVIKPYSQHEDWEVRDSALNLLHSCTEISFIKYIPLQKMIRNKDLMIVASKVALNDPEFYSQCMALKCLTAATKIDCIWQDVLANNPHIYAQLVYILMNHGEGMVRKEAANVLTAVYTNQKIESGFHNVLYEVMQKAAVDDLHWEVQLAALNFWKSAIKRQQTYRGMLDGKFPSVTFSKEKRKIIVLNDAEIRRQLSNIMNHLSSIGCLTVLLECMDEINNIEVMNQAYRITKELIEMLDKYKFEKVIDSVEAQQTEIRTEYEEEDNSMPIDLSCTNNEEEKIKVINSILSVDYSELIINLHDNYCQIKFEEMDIEYAPSPRRKIVHPNKFLENFKHNNYSKVIENKRNCNSHRSHTLDELLDEMLDL